MGRVFLLSTRSHIQSPGKSTHPKVRLVHCLINKLKNQAGNVCSKVLLGSLMRLKDVLHSEWDITYIIVANNIQRLCIMIGDHINLALARGHPHRLVSDWFRTVGFWWSTQAWLRLEISQSECRHGQEFALKKGDTIWGDRYLCF